MLSVGGTLIRGSIDLLAVRADGSVLVVDYKTDRLAGRDPAEIVSRYSIQRDLYALAAAARGAPVETAYVFLERPDEPVRTSFDRGGARGGPGSGGVRPGEARVRAASRSPTARTRPSARTARRGSASAATARRRRCATTPIRRSSRDATTIRRTSASRSSRLLDGR